MIIFVHIPKTAGTSLAQAFDVSCHRRMMYDYDPTYLNARMTEREERLIAEHKDFILEKFDYIHGHFYLSKYKKVFAEQPFVTCFRRPVDRIVSQYKHYCYGRIESPTATAIRSGAMSLVDFASQKNIRDAQLAHMDGYTLDDLAFFFLTENMRHGVKAFNRMFNKKVPVPQRINTSEERFAIGKLARKTGAKTNTEKKSRLFALLRSGAASPEAPAQQPRKIDVSPAELEEVARIARDDVDFYRLAVDRYKNRFGDALPKAALQAL